MILPFLTVCAVIAIILIVKSRYGVLCNEMFWLTAAWILIIGVYLFSGIQWEYPVSLRTWTFVAVCFFMFGLWRYIGMHHKETARSSKHGMRFSVKSGAYICIGLIGTVVFIIDYIRINGIQTTKTDYSISFIGTVGNLCVPVLLVIGLYLFADSYINRGKLDIKGMLCLVVYIIPCVINGGRENVLYLMISLIAVIGYAKWADKMKGVKKKKKSLFSKIVIIVATGALVYIIVLVSNNRFTGEVTNFYFNAMNVPNTMWKEAEMFGGAKNLYANFVYYAAHELAGLEMVLQFYDGPYMFGMYELNIISRRLPSSLGLDYRRVSEAMRMVMEKTGDAEVLIHGWKTMLASLVFDFGKWASPLVCGVLGFLVGKVRKHFKEQQSVEYLVLVAILCMFMFTTIQLGPFFNFGVYGSCIWWAVIFKSPFAVRKKKMGEGYDSVHQHSGKSGLQ